MKLLRYNKEPIKFPDNNLISVQPKGNLIEVEYIRPINNQVVCELGYYLQRG
jgi:hypothetical protein